MMPNIMGVLGAVGVWAPSSGDSSLVLWLDALDDATVWEDVSRTTPAGTSGDPIAAWDDKSASANHFTQGTAANQPARYADGIYFNTNDFLAAGSTALSSGTVARTVYVAFIAYATGLYYLLDLCSSGLDHQAFAPSLELGVRHVTTRSTFGAAPSTSTPHIFTLAAPASPFGSDVDAWLDGASRAGSVFSDFALNTTGAVAYAGSRNGSSPYLNGKLSEVLVYEADHDAAQRALVHEYLATKHGVTLS